MLSRTTKAQIVKRYRNCPIDCPKYYDAEIASLSEFFAVFHFLLEPGKMFWFRGHSDLEYRLAPSALRYDTIAERERALGLITDMKRFLGMRLDRPPAPNDSLGWMQVAQHHGLPTRLLDWTQNAAVSLFFACSERPESDGLVAILNPTELNHAVNPKLPRILDGERDAAVLEPYYRLGGRISSRGKRTVALNPTWNNERIALQHGCFTLHGSRKFDLDNQQASSLICVPILREHKESLLSELERVGIGEMFVFPEPEHVCSYLRRKEKL